MPPPRRVPEALRDPLKKELDSLAKQGIIAKVDEPTDWVNSLVCVTKSNGSLRLCLDPKDLNKAIKRPHHCTPTLDEVLPKLNGAKYFSIVDARSGYWNIQLDHESSLYTTFNSPQWFLRLPFGLICAQDIFQKKVDETFGDLPGITGIADDIIVYGYEEDGSDHDTNLRAVITRARKTGLRFNPDKYKIRCTELLFFGHIISASGLRPDPQKIEAIVNMDPSTSLTDMQTYLGMIQFLSRFMPNLASVSAILWDLTKKSSEFQWGPEHQSAVQQIKGLVTSPNYLQYFDGSKPVTIQVDASQRGLGAALIQDKGPVEYRSKLLTETEMRYSNIEREMLAVVHGLEKLHYYAYGRPVIVESDHKPLEAIFKKHLSHAPPRIARMMLRIQKYDVEIKYVPGKEIPLADALSRLSPCEGVTITGLDIQVHELHLHLNASPTRIIEIRNETAKDTVLNSLRAVITHSWPDKRAECPPHLHPYWNYRDELTVADGQYGFVHTTTSPYYPQANGFIERNVQTVKNLLQKCKESGADPHLAMLCLRTTPLDHGLPSLAMLCLRTTPLDHGLPSPAELLNSRVYQLNLPSISKSGLSSLADGDINAKLQLKQDKQKTCYDKTSKSLPPLYPQDPVRIFDNRSKTWRPGIIRDATESPRSFVVDMADGATLTRNRRHLHLTGETNITTDNGQLSTADLEPPSPAPKPAEPPATTLRRSSRITKPPEKLNLELNFHPHT